MSNTNPPSLESEMAEPPSLDSVLAKLGNPGRYQIVLMLLLATNYIPVVVNHILMAFYTGKVEFNCRVPSEGNRSLYIPTSNSSSDLYTWESCAVYTDPSNHSLGTEECSDDYGYEFHFHGENEWTVTAEWGLVCDRAFLAPLLTTTYFCGVMVGGVIFGSLSDRFGRRIIMFICLYSQCFIGIGLHFVDELLVFIGLRFVQGVFIQGLQIVTYSMVMELFCPSWRTLAGCVVEGFWAGGIILLAIIAKYVEHWRYIQLAINIPTLSTLLYIWIIPESLRWLLSKGKVKKAESVVNSYLGYNSLSLDPAQLRLEMEAVSRDLVSRQDARRPPDVTDILRVSSLRVRAIVLFFIWFSVSLCYYGITYYVPNLSGDRYLNFVMGGGIELGAYLLAFVVLGGFGRRVPLCLYLVLSGILCISVITVKTYVSHDVMDVPALVTGLALFGKASIVSCFCTIFIYSSEIFPTVIRTVGVGCCTFFGRVGSLLAPQVLLLGELVYEDKPHLVPFLTFGILCLVSGMLTLLLPETLNTKLPDTIEEAVAQTKEAPIPHHTSSASLDVGYGKCPEFVCVDGLIVSKEQSQWSCGSGTSEISASFVSNQGTLTTLRSSTEPDYEMVREEGDQGVSLANVNLVEKENKGGVFKNFSYSEMENEEEKEDRSTYTAIMRNNEELLNNHMANIRTRERLQIDTDTDYKSSSDTDSRVHLVGESSNNSNIQQNSESEIYDSTTSQCYSIISGVHPGGFQAQVKDPESIKEMLRQKLLVMNKDEIKL